MAATEAAETIGGDFGKQGLGRGVLALIPGRCPPIGGGRVGLDEMDAIGALLDVEADAVLGRAAGIIGVEHFAQPADLDTGIAVGLGIEIRIAAQALDGDCIGLQLLAAAGKRDPDEEAEQLAHDGGTLELGRTEDRFELGHNPVRLGLPIPGRFVSGHPLPFHRPSAQNAV